MGFKSKNIFLISFLAIAGIFGVSSAVINKQVNETPIVKEAKAYNINTYQNVMLFRKFTKYNWNKDSAKTAVKFTDDYGHECWSQIVEDSDIYKGGGSGNDEYIDYFIYPDNMDHGWTHFQFARLNSSCTSDPWNYVWNWALKKDFNGYDNTFAPLDYSDSNVHFYQQDIEANTYAAGETIFIRDTDGDAWTADSHYLQVHLWGCTLQTGDRYINATKVEGNYNDSYSDKIDHLYEAVIPAGSGRYKWFQLKRINPSTGTPTNQSSDFEVSRGHNVFHYKDTGWDGGVMKGAWDDVWSIDDDTRADYFSRYVIEQTGTVCTNNPSESDLSSGLVEPWGNCKTQYGQMSSAAQGVFYAATANESSHPGIGAQRYDRLVYLYGHKINDSETRYGTRSGLLEDFVNRWGKTQFTSFGAVRNLSMFNIFGDNGENGVSAIIITASSVALLSVTALSILVLKKRKSKEQE